jgi:hypothetical protein
LDWFADKLPAPDIVKVPLVVQTDGSLLVPHNAGRDQRFQAARISELEPVQAGQPFHYRLTPRSMALAQEQGISPERIVQFLEKASGRPLPASVRRAITRWAEKGVEGRVEAAIVLRVRDADILNTLRTNPKTRDYLGESLGDLAIMVSPEKWMKLVEATTQLGMLLDVSINDWFDK